MAKVPRATHTSDLPTYPVTHEQVRELRAVHADALHLADALLFVDATSDAIDRDGAEGVTARGRLQSILVILASTAQALADRIEALELAIVRSGQVGAR